MSIEIKVPELPESVADAVIANWYKNEGDTIAEDEVLVDLETDKVVLEVPAIHAGKITAINFKVGDTVKAGDLLAVIDDKVKVDAAMPAKTGTDDIEREKTTARASAATETPARTGAMSPSVRKMIAENNLDASAIAGSGKNGRILRQDVETHMAQLKKEAESVATAVPDAGSNEALVDKPIEGERLERRVPMTRLRARIAERLVQARHDAAILTTFNEVNMQPGMTIRNRYRDDFEKRFGVRLGFMSFFVQACVEALKRFPEVNASIDGNDVVYHGYYDIGVAVSGPNGLVVPVVRDADLMSIAQVEQAILDFATRAKTSALTLDDITGGTFTISNGGVFGSMLSTPILNPPQSAILGMHNIQQRAMVVDGEIVALPVMYLALSYDHRLIDGSSAVQFLVTVKQLLEDPSRMLLGL